MKRKLISLLCAVLWVVSPWTVTAQVTNVPIGASANNEDSPFTLRETLKRLNANDTWLSSQVGGGALAPAIVPEAVAYAQASGITNTFVVQRISGGIAELKQGGLWDRTQTYLFSSDFSRTSAPLSLKLVRGTNSAGCTFDANGVTFPSGSEHSEWPISSGTWARTLVWDYAGSTNVFDGRIFVQAGYFDNTGTNAIYCANSGTVARKGTLLVSGNGFDPMNGYIYLFDGRDRLGAITYDNTNLLKLWLDCLLMKTNGVYYSNSFTLSGAPSRVVFGQAWGGGTTYSNGSPMRLRSAFDVTGECSSNELRCLERAARWFDPREYNVVGLSDSRGGDYLSVPQTSWEWYLMTIQSNSNARWYWNGASGATIDALKSASYRYAPYAPGGGVKGAAMYHQAAVNNIGAGDSGLLTYLKLATNANYFSSLGYSVAVFTESPKNSTTWTATMRSNLNVFDTLLVSNASFAAKLVRLDQLHSSQMMNTNFSLLRTIEGVHLTPLGNLECAEFIAGILPPLTEVWADAKDVNYDATLSLLTSGADTTDVYHYERGLYGAGNALHTFNISIPDWATEVSGNYIVDQVSTVSTVTGNLLTNSYLPMTYVPGAGRTFESFYSRPVGGTVNGYVQTNSPVNEEFFATFAHGVAAKTIKVSVLAGTNAQSVAVITPIRLQIR